MDIKKGNSVTLRVAAQDIDGNIITNLSTATVVKYMVKKNKTDADIDAEISKNLGSGITVDTPVTGTIEIILTSDDTDIDIGNYYQALQIEYSSTDKQEINIKEGNCTINSLTIIQDIVR